MFRNFSWVAFAVGVAFALFIWPMVGSMFARKRTASA